LSLGTSTIMPSRCHAWLWPAVRSPEALLPGTKRPRTEEEFRPGLSSVPTAIGRASPAGPGPPSGTGWSEPRRPPLLPVVEVLRVGQREQPHRLARPHLVTAHARSEERRVGKDW